MKEDQRQFLVLLGRPPARLAAEQAAWLLNCAAHDVPVLVAARLLKPLGSPQPNSTKLFATAELLEAATDRAWLARVTQTLQQYWRGKNGRKASRIVDFPSDSTRTNAALRRTIRA